MRPDRIPLVALPASEPARDEACLWWCSEPGSLRLATVEFEGECAHGRSRADWGRIGDLLGLVVPIERGRVAAAAAAARSGGGALNLECGFLAPDGRARTIRIAARATGDGRLQGVLLAEDPVASHGLDRRQRLRAILDGTRVGTWEWNATTDETVFDEQWATLLGYTLAELQPVSLETWKRLTHPEDLARATELLARHFAGEIDHYECELRMRHKDGHWVWILDRGRLATRTTGGAPEWMFGTHTDITQKRSAQDEVQANADLMHGLADLQRDFVVEADPRVSFDRMLAFLLRSTGSASGFIGEVHSRLDGQPYLRMWAITNIAWNDETQTIYAANGPFGMEFDNLQTLFGSVLMTRRPVISNDPRHDSRRGGTPTGHPPLDSFLGLPLFLGDEMIGMLGMANRAGGYDEALVARLESVVATCASLLHAHRLARQRESSERQQRELEARLQQAQRLESLGLLAGGIAHDFNNLLTSILGRVELASVELPVDSPAAEHLQNAIQASVRASELVDQLLAYAGKSRRASESVDVSTVAEEMSRLLAVSMPKSCSLHLDLRRDLPPVKVDTAQMRQVLMNLVINAGEATCERGDRVVVRSGLVELDAAEGLRLDPRGGLGAGTYVFVEVEDNGCGMDEATRDRIFEPFFTTKFTGRGLGLSAVLGIVQSHGGAIECRSERGVGTTFRVLLPAVAERVVAVAETVESPATTAWSTDALVLLVDDDAMVRAVAQQFLVECGCRVLCASEGAEALDLMQRRAGELDLVLLDYTMPRMSGSDVVAEMSRRGYAVPVVLTSGFRAEGLGARAGFDGVAAFLDKPYSRARFREVLRSVLERPTRGT